MIINKMVEYWPNRADFSIIVIYLMKVLSGNNLKVDIVFQIHISNS